MVKKKETSKKKTSSTKTWTDEKGYLRRRFENGKTGTIHRAVA